MARWPQSITLARKKGERVRIVSERLNAPASAATAAALQPAPRQRASVSRSRPPRTTEASFTRVREMLRAFDARAWKSPSASRIGCSAGRRRMCCRYASTRVGVAAVALDLAASEDVVPALPPAPGCYACLHAAVRAQAHLRAAGICCPACQASAGGPPMWLQRQKTPVCAAMSGGPADSGGWSGTPIGRPGALVIPARAQPARQVRMKTSAAARISHRGGPRGSSAGAKRARHRRLHYRQARGGRQAPGSARIRERILRRHGREAVRRTAAGGPARAGNRRHATRIADSAFAPTGLRGPARSVPPAQQRSRGSTSPHEARGGSRQSTRGAPTAHRSAR